MNNIENLKPFKRLCVTIGNLPTAYIESMSYYECITYLVNYLTREVVPTVNNNSEVVKELQSYVEHYFDNLDVQEEINNKLDDMAESGQLTDIIAQYIELAGVLAYNTVSDMKTAENLTNGSICKTLGFHDINDGGGANYKIRTITNDDIVDEMTIIALDDISLIAELIIENPLNIKKLGAYGDNTHDDITYINKALNLSKSILIPDGTYKITTSINLTDEYILKCYGILNYTGNDSCIKIDGIRNILNIKQIYSSNNGITLTDSNKLNYGNDIYINNIIADNYGILLSSINTDNGIQYNNFIGNEINGDNGSVYLELTSLGNHVNENRFENFHFASDSGDALTIIDKKHTGASSECSGNRFLFIGFENCENAIVLDQTRYNSFVQCRSEESIREKHIVFKNFCTSNFIEKDITPMNKVDTSNLTSGTQNIISGIIYDNDTNFNRLTNKIDISYGFNSYIPSALFYINTFTLDGTSFTFNDIAYTYIASKDNSTIKLGNVYCNYAMIGYSFIVNTGNPSRLIDKNDDVIIETSDSEYQGYKNIKISLAGINPNNGKCYWTKEIVS